MRSYGIFWANELIATLQPAPSVRPQITTVSPPVTTGPELTSILPDTTKQPELITHSKVISTETLTKVSDVSVIGNATTVVVGKDSTLINNETTNISLGVGKLSIEEKASYSMTNISYNDNNTSNLIHDIAASLMLSKISNLADDYFAFTKPLDNETIGNISEAQPAADLEATFLSVLDVKTNDQDSVNENDKALLSSESKNKTNGTRTANTLQDLNSTTLNESSTQPVEVDTRLFSTYHSHKQQSTVLSKTTFNTDTTTKGMTDFATSRIPPIPDHTIHTNTISSKTFHPLSSDFYSNQSTDSVNHTLVTTFPTTSLFDVLRSNKTLFTTRTPSQTISTIEDNVTQLKTTISNVAEKANTAVNQITALPTETPKMVSSTSYLNLLNHTDETESNTTNTSIIANKHKQSTSEKNVIDTTEADLKETTKTINHTVSDSKAYTDAGLQTTRDVTSVATVNLEDITKASISETTLPKVTDDLDHNKLISTLTAVTEDIPKVKEVTTLPVVVDTEDKIVATSTADMGNIITKDTLPFTYETTTALESTTTETHSSTRFSTELTTVTTLPPIIARTFPVRKPKVRPRTNDVWLKMNPGPVTVNNLFKLMPTTKRVWLKVEPTVRPPVFVQPAFKVIKQHGLVG